VATIIQAVSAPLYLPSSKFARVGTNKAAVANATKMRNGKDVFNVTLLILKIIFVKELLTGTIISGKIEKKPILSHINKK
jgi:hypothetical protein